MELVDTGEESGGRSGSKRKAGVGEPAKMRRGGPVRLSTDEFESVSAEDCHLSTNEIFRNVLRKLNAVTEDVRVGCSTSAQARKALELELERYVLLCPQDRGVASVPGVRLTKELMERGVDEFARIPVLYKCANPPCVRAESTDGSVQFPMCPNSGLYYCGIRCRDAHSRTAGYPLIAKAHRERTQREAIRRDVEAGEGVQRSFRIAERAEFTDCLEEYGKFLEYEAIATKRGEPLRLVDSKGREVSKDEYHRRMFGITATELSAISGKQEDAGGATPLAAPTFGAIVASTGERRDRFLAEYAALGRRHEEIAARVMEIRAGAVVTFGRKAVLDEECEVDAGAGAGAGAPDGAMDAEGAEDKPPLPPSEGGHADTYDLEREAYDIRVRSDAMRARWSKVVRWEREYAKMIGERGKVPDMGAVMGRFEGYTPDLLRRLLSSYGVNPDAPVTFEDTGFTMHSVDLRCPFNTHAIVMAATTQKAPDHIRAMHDPSRRSGLEIDFYFRKLAFLFRDMTESPSIMRDAVAELEYVQAMERCVVLCNPPFGLFINTPEGSCIMIGNVAQRKRLGEQGVDAAVASLTEKASRMKL